MGGRTGFSQSAIENDFVDHDFVEFFGYGFLAPDSFAVNSYTILVPSGSPRTGEML